MIDLLEQRVAVIGSKSGLDLSLDLDICPKCSSSCYVIRLNNQVYGGLYLPHGSESDLELQAVVFELSTNVIVKAIAKGAFKPQCYSRLLVGFDCGKHKTRKPSFLVRIKNLGYVINDPMVLRYGVPPADIRTN